ncbi:MAG TPA: site-specific DNA-methyltransferase [Verrucomicrobiae bacterium]|nr:site-specific DNA-methyltransferase [Verrucomicrobiae bacterium]
MTVRILNGDCRDVLATLPAESVHCVVTSPPYWGLRDYGVAGQIGLESTYQDFVEQTVAVFREVRRVLRADGTLWLNLGDSYFAGHGGSTTEGNYIPKVDRDRPANPRARPELENSPAGWAERDVTPKRITAGCKPKDLMGIPWRVALALQEDGWWLRQDIIWSKPNPMPESVTDRCTKAHEYLFLLSKSARYYYDAEAIREDMKAESVARYNYAFGGAKSEQLTAEEAAGPGSRTHPIGMRKVKIPGGWDTGAGAHGTIHREGRTEAEYVEAEPKPGRNKRSVWEVATAPFPEAHFATFPPALIEPCILAGCPKGGTVLDPFGGAGTTGLVADRLQRSAILIELNPVYADMARKRIVGDSPLFVEAAE